jgi:alpha-ribazole phosphatase
MASDPQYRRWVDSMCEGPVPGGESLEQFRKRVTERFESLAAQVLSEGGRDLLIVAHGGTQMAVMERFCTRKRPYWSWQSPPGEAVRAVITAKAR